MKNIWSSFIHIVIVLPFLVGDKKTARGEKRLNAQKEDPTLKDT